MATVGRYTCRRHFGEFSLLKDNFESCRPHPLCMLQLPEANAGTLLADHLCPDLLVVEAIGGASSALSTPVPFGPVTGGGSISVVHGKYSTLLASVVAMALHGLDGDRGTPRRLQRCGAPFDGGNQWCHEVQCRAGLTWCGCEKIKAGLLTSLCILML